MSIGNDQIFAGLKVAPSLRLALKIGEMLTLRDGGHLTKEADDYISGLVNAYGLTVGIADQPGAALEAATEELRTAIVEGGLLEMLPQQGDPSYNGADHFAPITDLTDPEVIKDRQAEAEMA